MTFHNDNLVWLDLEMTGLDPDSDVIIEIATIVTDSNLNTLAEGPVFAIHQPDDVLDKMNKWNTNTHTKSGLVKRVQESTTTLKDAQIQTIEFLKEFVPHNKSPMCGNSICQDRRFLYRYMPKLEKYFHYRNLDVSTLKELAKRWKPEVVKAIEKESKHEALDDIRESIKELAHYRECFISA